MTNQNPNPETKMIDDALFQTNLGFNLLYLPQAELDAQAELRPILMLLASQQFDEALTQIQALIKTNPTRAGAYYYRAYIHFNRKRLRLCLQDCNRAIEWNAQFIGAYIFRGLVLLMQRKLRLALADFELILSLNPASPEGYMGRGMALYLLGQYERRIHRFGTFIDYRYGWHELNHAIADFDYALHLKPNDRLLKLQAERLRRQLNKKNGL